MSINSLLCLLPNDWALIGAKATRVAFKLGDEIIQQGAQINHFFVIRHGSATVELATAHSSVVLAVLQEGDVCGEVTFLEKTKAVATVVAKDLQVEADAIPAQDLRELLYLYPGFSSRFYESLALILAQRLRSTSGELVRAINATKSFANMNQTAAR